MGNTIGVCSDVAWPTTDGNFVKVPTTDAFDFQTAFGPNATPTGGSGPTVAGFNLNLLIGTKVAVAYQSGQFRLRNQKGETAS